MYPTLIVLLSLISNLVTAREPLHPLSDDFIDLINKEGKWKAGRNFHPDTPLSYIKQLLGANTPNPFEKSNLPVVEHDVKFINNLPESFDPRNKWANCPSLNEIRDQGKCGSCWAFGAVSAMTDRVCIYSNGTKHFHFSAEDLLACNNIGSCFGGLPSAAWESWVHKGLVSGGNYKSHRGCKPYSIPTCPHHMEKCTHYGPSPACVRSCVKGYNVSYHQDKRHGKSAYEVFGEGNMMAEMYKNGPIEVMFTVYEDLAVYKSGVYQHIQGKPLTGHAVKMMGWGVEDGKKYWLIANSWGTGFGDKGFFKILRGVNESDIEKYQASAGEPLLEEY